MFLHCFIFSFAVFDHIACIASLVLLQITCGCSTDSPDCECSREYEGQDAELGLAARTHVGSGYLLGASDPPIWQIAHIEIAYANNTKKISPVS
jgi:hypothetical protein